MLDYFKYVIKTGKILQAAFSLPKLFLIGTTNPRRYCHVVRIACHNLIVKTSRTTILTSIISDWLKDVFAFTIFT